MKQLLVIFTLVLLTSFVFAADCQAGFQENLKIRVLDGKLRPLEGASVQVTYQVDQTTNKGYKTTNPVITPKNGTINQVILNREIRDDRVKCDITINATFDNTTVSRVIKAENHENLIDVNLEAYQLNIQVLDNLNRPIDGAIVAVNEQFSTTNAQGFVAFKAHAGNARVFASWKEAKTERMIVLKDDAMQTLEIGRYALDLEVFDDAGVPLLAQAIIAGKEYAITDGKLHVDDISEPQTTIEIQYKGVTQTQSIDLRVQGLYQMYVDSTPPSISKVVEIESTDKRRFAVVATDPNQFASGIDTKSLVFRWSKDNKEWQKSLTYINKKGELVAEVDSSVETFYFEAELKDNAGNKQIISGKLVKKEETQPVQNQTETPSQIAQPSGGELPIIPIVIGFVVVAGIVFAVLHLKKQHEEEAS